MSATYSIVPELYVAKLSYQSDITGLEIVRGGTKTYTHTHTHTHTHTDTHTDTHTGCPFYVFFSKKKQD